MADAQAALSIIAALALLLFKVVVSGLSHPWSIAWLPDGSALVTERVGRLRLIRDGELDPRPIIGLLLSVGDGGNPPISFDAGNIRNQAQNPGTHFGAVLRLEDDDTVHPDNPFSSRQGDRPEIWTMGHRNIQGMTRDSVSGRLWANEHGSRGGDELNVIDGGNNFGWPELTYSNEYWGPRIAEETSRTGIADPIFVWIPSKAPSGLTFYTGNVYPKWSDHAPLGRRKHAPYAESAEISFARLDDKLDGT